MGTSVDVTEKVETYILSVISGQRQGKRAAVLRWFLKELSYVFASAVQFRLWLYSHGILRHNALGCQVISVGNLTVGGTGKTPVVEVFARSLQKSGRRIAILSRGYKKSKPSLFRRLNNKITRHVDTQQPLVVSDGKRLLLESEFSGDEPYMLASNLPEVVVLVGSDRVKSGRYAIKKLGCDTLILDDGFQYMKLKHRLDIVLVDSKNPFGNKYTLPRGVLREPVKNIRRAGFIFITKCDDGGAPELRRELRELNPDAEIVECRHCPRYLQDVYTGERRPLSFLKDKPIVALSGIAAPKSFEEGLERLGAKVVYHKQYADHHRYTQQEIIDRINKSIRCSAQMIVTTEKDAVRFPKIERRDLPLYFLRVDIEMISGVEDFEACISRICFK